MSTSEDDQTGSSSEGGFPQFSDEKHSSTQGHRTDAEDDDDYFMADLTAGVDIASMIRGVTISEDDLFDTGPTDPQEQ